MQRGTIVLTKYLGCDDCMEKLFARVLSIFLCVAICFSLVACGKSETVKGLDELILQIGDVTLEKADTIENIKQQYDALTEKEKEQIENLSILTDAIAILETLKAEESSRIAEENRKKQLMQDNYLKVLQWIADNGTAIVEENDINQYGQVKGYSYQYKCREDRMIKFYFETDASGDITGSLILSMEWEKTPKEYNHDANIDYDLNQKFLLDIANGQIEYIWSYGAWAISINKSNIMASGKIQENLADIILDKFDYFIKDYTEIDTFRKVSGYQDVRAELSKDFCSTITIFAEFLKLKTGLNMKDLGFINCSDFDETVNYVGIKAENQTVSAGHSHALALCVDGTVLATGDNTYGQCDVSVWTDIISVSAGYDHSVGLKADGTVIAVGANEISTPGIAPRHTGACDVSQWTDIVAICAGFHRTFGVCSNGTVVATGEYATVVSNWTDIIGVYDATTHIVGLKSDGTVVVAGDNAFGECDVSEWTGIVDISGCMYTTVGLRYDGTILVTGSYADDTRTTWKTSELSNVVDVEAIPQSCLAVRVNGALVEGCHSPMDTDVIAVSATGNIAVFLKADGTVRYWSAFEELDISSWNNIKLPAK